MQRKLWVTGLCALALALAFPGLAAAQDDAFDDLECPIPAVTGQDGWIAAEIVDYLQTLAVGELGDDWTTLNDDDVAAGTIAAVQARGQTSYAIFALIQAIISDADQVSHGDVCPCVLQDMRQMADDTTTLTDSLQPGHNNGDKTLAAIILAYNAADVAAAVADAAESAADFLTPGLSDASLYCSVGEFLNDDGDADDDGQTNIQEWTATFAGATFGQGGQAGFKALVDQYVLNATAGTNVAVVVSGADELLIGSAFDTDTYTAVSTDVLDLDFAFESSDEAVVTIDAGTGVATGLTPGTVTISATGDNSNAVGEKEVTARVPAWQEICDISGTFAAQGGLLAGAIFETTWDQLDLDALAGDAPLKDQFQFQLLAYSLCEGAKVAGAPDGAQVNVEFDTNLADLQALNENFADVAAWIGDGVTAGYTGKGVLFAQKYLSPTVAGTINAVLPNSGPTTGIAASLLGGAAAILPGFQAVGAAQPDIEELGSTAPFVDDLVAGYVGSPFGAAFFASAFGFGTLQGLFASSIPQLSGGADEIAGALLTPLISPFFPDIFDPLIGAEYAAFGEERDKLNSTGAGDLGDPDPVNIVIPDWETFDGVAKDGALPFSGFGTYDSVNGFFEAPDLDTNGELAQAVIDGGGDEFDFVSLATGLDAFVEGSPFLPVAGALGLGLMAGALAFAGAKRVLRRS